MNLAAALVLLWKYLYFWQAIRRQCYWWRFRSTSKHTDFWSYDLLLQNHGRLRSGPKAVWHAQERIYWCASLPSTIRSTGRTKSRILSLLPGPTQIRIESHYQARPKTTYHMCYQARPEPKYFSCHQPDSNPNIIRATRSSGSRRSLGTTTKILGIINVFCEPNEPTFPRSYKSIRSINSQLTTFNVLPSWTSSAFYCMLLCETKRNEHFHCLCWFEAPALQAQLR